MLSQFAGPIASGIIKIKSGPILAAPVFDLDLPGGFCIFRLALVGMSIVSPTSDWPAFALSYDGGHTWLNDQTHADSYVSLGTSNDKLGYVTNQNISSSGFADLDLTINPGTTSKVARVTAVGFTLNPSAVGTGISPSGSSPGNASVNPQATVAPPATRATTMRLLPFGNGDALSASGHLLSAAAYVLWGISADA